MHAPEQHDLKAETCLAVVRALFIVLAIAGGIAFRFYHLSAHGFWGDEGTTALHAAGHTAINVVTLLSGNRPVTAAAVEGLRSASGRTIWETVHALASEDPGHPPAYYAVAQLWEQAFGSSAFSLRLVSALLSLLLLPAMYWLCAELFSSRMTAWTGTAIASISPYNVEFSQQAREYGFWAVVIVVSSAVLLRALREGRAAWWTAYALVSALGLYTHYFFLLVIVSQVAYVLGLAAYRNNRTLKVFLLSLAVAVLAALPWYVTTLGNIISQAPSYRHQGFHAAVYAWSLALGAPFVDLEFLSVWYFGAVAAAIALISCAVVLMVRKTEFRQWWFVLTLIGSTMLLQLGNTGLTDNERYLAPTMLGLQLAVAWLLSARLSAANWSGFRQSLQIAVLALVFGFGFFDCFVRAQQVTWWSNEYGAPIIPIARQIDSTGAAVLVIGQAMDWEAATDLAAFLKPSDEMWFVDDLHRWKRLAGGRNVYVFSRYPNLRDAVARKVPLEPVTVLVAARGYNLLDSERSGHDRGELVTWLWRATVGPNSSAGSDANL